LHLARNMTAENLEHPAFGANDRQILRAIACHCDFLEGYWGRIERFCAGMPRTLVHGDLSLKNARIQANHTGNRLLVMDWESAGWGVPAVDLAQFAWSSLTPDIAAYWSVTQARWPRLDLSILRQLGELGRVFRWLSAVLSANQGFSTSPNCAGTIEWYITEMRCYEPQETEWAQGVEALLELGGEHS
jgi:hypothetical protein